MISKYNPDLFHVALLQPSSQVGSFILGSSKLGPANWGGWTELAAASFSYSANYDRDDKGTLIVGSETASVSISRNAKTFAAPLYPSDHVRAIYNSRVLFDGIVDSTRVTKTSLSGWPKKFRWDFTATLVGAYALAMTKTVCYGDLPQETALARIQRWVTIVD